MTGWHMRGVGFYEPRMLAADGRHSQAGAADPGAPDGGGSGGCLWRPAHVLVEDAIGLAGPRLHAERDPLGDLHGDRARVRPRRRDRPARDRARGVDRRDQAAGDRPGRLRDPRHPRSGDRPRARPVDRRDPADRATAARGRDRRVEIPRSEAAAGPDRRGQRRSVRHRGVGLGGARQRRRSGQGQDDHDRLQRGRGPAGGTRRRGDRVLERRGRHAAAPPARLSRVPRRRLRSALLPGAGRLRLRRLPARPPGPGPGVGPDPDARLQRGDPEPARRRARARVAGAGT